MPGSVEPEPGANDSIEHRKLLAEYGGRYDDAKVAAMVAGIVGRLSAAAGPMNAPLRLTILNSATVNAFALPDGGLYVTRGLIALANDESELAAVIAHEIAHVQADHARLRQRQASAAQLAQRVSEVVNDPMIRADSAGQAVTSLARFSQQQELEADEEGVKLTAAAGFDPFAAARFLRSMQRFAALPTLNSASAEQPGFLSTHPSAPDRIDRATRTARQFGSPGATNKPSGSFLRSIDGNMFGDDPSEGFVRGREFVHVDMGIAFTVPDGYTLRNTSAAVLATDGENTAIRFDAARDTARGDLEAYLKSGWVRGLIPDSVRVTEEGGKRVATGSALVDGWSFRIGVVQGRAFLYRFIFASSNAASSYEPAFQSTLASFRILSPAQKAAMRPLRIRTVAVRPNDTVAGLAARMRGVTRDMQRPLFEALNAVDATNPPTVGQLVKIVTE